MWVATVDFQKVFHSIQHEGIWRSIKNHSISKPYISLLTKHCDDQCATVLTDVESTISRELEARSGETP